MDVSVVIRTLNEARHLPALLKGIKDQRYDGGAIETVVVDSGSTDGTIEIAQAHDARLVHIRKEDFSFGRSLNVGCDAATGQVLVFISGHCIPASDSWIANLAAPLRDEVIAYSYGRQIGDDTSRFSETRIFAKYFPDRSSVPQDGFYCNNANSALRKDVWVDHPFDEELTGLEDMHLAKRLTGRGYKIAYIAEAPVFHLHDESWRQIRRRFEREALALQHIMPEVHMSYMDMLRYLSSAVMFDCGDALAQRRLMRTLPEILSYRVMQFWGSYKGNHLHRNLSHRAKERYFYPR